MTDPTPAPAPTLEHPSTGGSFLRQPDGTLMMVEGAIAPAEPAADTPLPADADTQPEEG